MVFRIGLISMTGSTRWRTFESRRVYRETVGNGSPLG
jgi:hypothetical protein